MRSWITKKEHHAHMAMRQSQNRFKTAFNKAELWMAGVLDTTGYYWTKQAVWGFRVYDFWCPYLGIVVEVDGPNHDAEKDRQCDADDMTRSGILVLRVPNFDAEKARDVVQRIRDSATWNERRLTCRLVTIKTDYSSFVRVGK